MRTALFAATLFLLLAPVPGLGQAPLRVIAGDQAEAERAYECPLLPKDGNGKPQVLASSATPS